MDRIRQRVNDAYNETFGYLLMGLWVFFFSVWGVVTIIGCMHPEHQKAHPAFQILFVTFCALGWGFSAGSSIRALEFWLRTPQVRRPYDENRDRYGNGLPL